MIVGIVLLALVVVGVVVRSTRDHQRAVPAPTGPTEPTSKPAPASPPKPKLTGLINIGGFPSNPDNFGGNIVQIGWNAFQPSKTADFVDALGPSIAEARTYNATHAGRYGIKLRIIANDAATPGWVRDAAGTVTIYMNKDAGGNPINPHTITRFWTAEYRDAYAALIRRLSSAYDGVDVLRDVAISECSMIFDEPMVRWTNIRANNVNMLDAGYTLTADDACQLGNIDILKSEFLTTYASESFSTFQGLYGTPTSPKTYKAYDVAPAEAAAPNSALRYMNYCRSVLGDRCILGNNEAGRDSLVDPATTVDAVLANPSICRDPPDQQNIYVFQKSHGPVYYQSENPNPGSHGATAGSLACGVVTAARQGASYYELAEAGVTKYFGNSLTDYEPRFKSMLKGA